jgi:hypothetical protein
MDKKLVGLAALLIISVAAYFIFVFWKVPFAIFTQASQTNSPSTISSLIFAWPLDLPADGKTPSEITVFIRSEDGRGIPEESVRLTSTVGDVKESLLTTNSEGKAIFHITSAQVGVAEIEAFVDNKKLQRTISVKFR